MAPPRKSGKPAAKRSSAKTAATKPVSETKRPRGRPTDYKPEFAEQAEKLCKLGATDAELADFFNVTTMTIWRWQSTHEKFCYSLRAGKDALDERVQRSLFQRAVGYSHDSVKIFMPSGTKEPVYAGYREHVPPDPGAAKLWLCNRRPSEWRDRSEQSVSINHDVSDLTDEELLAIAAKAKKTKD
jgi:hypothetical protein